MKTLLKTSPNRILFIADSQFGKLSILDINRVRITDLFDYLPRKNQYNTIVLFIGAMDSFQKNGTISGRSPPVLPTNSTSWKTHVLIVRKKYIFSLPPRYHLPDRTKVNEVLASWKSQIGTRSISRHIYSEQHIRPGDDVHLTEVALIGVKNSSRTRCFTRSSRQQYTQQATQTSTTVKPFALVVAILDLAVGCFQRSQIRARNLQPFSAFLSISIFPTRSEAV